MQVQNVNGSKISFGARLDARVLSKYMFMNSWNSKGVYDSLKRLHTTVGELGTREDVVVINGITAGVVNNKEVLTIEGLINNKSFRLLHEKELLGFRDLAEHVSQVLTGKGLPKKH